MKMEKRPEGGGNAEEEGKLRKGRDLIVSVEYLMKGKITTFTHVYPMSCWSICTAYWNVLLYGCAMNCEEKNLPWRPASLSQSQCPVPLDPCPE